MLGLRLVKKTVNQDDPSVYHLFYADEQGRPAPTSRSSSTRARRPAAPAPGWSTGSAGASPRRDALDFWASGWPARASTTERDGDRLRFADPEGLDHELVVVDAPTRR